MNGADVALNPDTAIQSLFARTAHGIRPGLEVVTALLERLGNPHHGLKCIHVAGTNGKGSVCAMIESVLRASGFKTGLYTSPHLIRFNERFRINGREISDAALGDLILRAETAEQQRGQSSHSSIQAGQAPDGRPATFFELSTAMAFDWFRREKVDYAVIETGMGGRWDATNVVHPVLSVITRIDVDHTGYLGAEIEKIAWEKAGIIKVRTPVVCGPMPVEAEGVIYKEAAEKEAPIVGSDAAVFCRVLEHRRTDQLIDIEAGGREYRHVRLPLAGGFQIENCGIAVAALEDLADLDGLQLRIKAGLEAVRWTGRFQMLSMKPPVVYDGAHNPGGARALVRALQEIFPQFEYGFVFGFMNDKDATGFLKTVAPVTEKAWALSLPGERAMPADQISKCGQQAGLPVLPAESPQPALDWLAAGKKRLVCFTGSLYLPEKLKQHGLFHD